MNPRDSVLNTSRKQRPKFFTCSLENFLLTTILLKGLSVLLGHITRASPFLLSILFKHRKQLELASGIH